MCHAADSRFPCALLSSLFALHDDRNVRRGVIGIRLTAKLNICNRVANSEDCNVSGGVCRYFLLFGEERVSGGGIGEQPRVLPLNRGVLNQVILNEVCSNPPGRDAPWEWIGRRHGIWRKS